MKTKVMTPEKLEKIRVKREKEIAKWEKEKARPKRNYYFAYLVLIICIIYATDEIASQISTLMKTEIANDLFSKFGESSVGLLDILSILVFIVHIVHALLDHKDAQSAFFAFLDGKRGIRVCLCKRVVLLSVVDKGYFNR